MSLYDKFCADIEKYLNSKLPDIPQCTTMEIGEYISSRVQRLVQETYIEYEEKMEERNKRFWERYARSKPKGE